MPNLKTATACLTLLLFNSPAMADLATWQGQWQGECQAQNYNSDANIPAHTMRLKISKHSDRNDFEWEIQYPPEPARRYVMLGQTDLPGHYLLDERNGLVIDRFYHHGVLRDMFTLTNGKTFISSMRLINGQLVTESASFWSRSGRRSTVDGNPSFGLDSFFHRDVTNCRLQRVTE